MPVVDLAFRLLGKEIPADHGFALYGAVARLVPWTHEPSQETLGIHPINGLLAGNRLFHLTPRSRLTFRLDSAHIGELLPLAGKELDLDGHKLRVSVPTTYPLRPRATLRSRLVTIKNHMAIETFLPAAQAALEALGIHGRAMPVRRRFDRSLEGRSGANRDPFVRRTLRIHDREVVGYELIAQDLTAEESLALQEHGLGGRRRFGCGIFVPVRE